MQLPLLSITCTTNESVRRRTYGVAILPKLRWNRRRRGRNGRAHASPRDIFVHRRHVQVQPINGAQSKNVFWYVPAGAVIGTGSTVVGTLLFNAAISMSTTGGSPPTAVLTILNGRAIALTAAVTMPNIVIDVPVP